ncbi:MAG: YceI family protein [Pseudomonadota bacterium]
MKLRFAIAVFGTLCCSIGSAAAEWALSSDESQINFVSVKAGEIPESHHFKTLNGGVDANGDAVIKIALDSVETMIDIRNERMREFLFETDQYPTASITASINLDGLEKLTVGEREKIELSGQLDFHGVKAPVDTTLIVTRIADNRVLVETNSPIILYTEEYNLAAGVAKLMELASLPSITPASPVTASLVFERKE